MLSSFWQCTLNTKSFSKRPLKESDSFNGLLENDLVFRVHCQKEESIARCMGQGFVTSNYHNLGNVRNQTIRVGIDHLALRYTYKSISGNFLVTQDFLLAIVS